MSDLRMLGYLGCSFLLRDARKEAGTGRDVGTSLLGTITDVITSLGGGCWLLINYICALNRICLNRL